MFEHHVVDESIPPTSQMSNMHLPIKNALEFAHESLAFSVRAMCGIHPIIVTIPNSSHFFMGGISTINSAINIPPSSANKTPNGWDFKRPPTAGFLDPWGKT